MRPLTPPRPAPASDPPRDGAAEGRPEPPSGRLSPARGGSRLSALLNVHSYFSFGAGTASPTSLVRRAAVVSGCPRSPGVSS